MQLMIYSVKDDHKSSIAIVTFILSGQNQIRLGYIHLSANISNLIICQLSYQLIQYQTHN